MEPGLATMKTVLVAEDSPATREIVMRLLRREGYNVIGATNGREALAAAKDASPDLILLDVMMPEMDGFTVLAALRDQPDTRELPVILLTALSDEERMRRARDLGARAYLVKTRFSYDELLGQVEKHAGH